MLSHKVYTAIMNGCTPEYVEPTKRGLVQEWKKEYGDEPYKITNIEKSTDKHGNSVWLMQIKHTNG